MGNRLGYSQGNQQGDLNVQENTPLVGQINEEQTNQPEQTSSSSPVSVPKQTAIKRATYVHPFIDMINRNCSEAEMINTLQAFCGRVEVGTDQYGRSIYESVDQIEFTAPVLQVFSYCACNGKKSVVDWLVNNFVPLQVSYDNNHCFFECLRWKHYDIADMIARHESFNPSVEALENLLSRNKYADFGKCMSSPYLRGDFHTYRFTFQYYVNNNQFSNANSLFQKIKQRMTNPDLVISDEVYPNPRLAQQVQQTQTVQETQSVQETQPDQIPVPQEDGTVSNESESECQPCQPEAAEKVCMEPDMQAVDAQITQQMLDLHHRSATSHFVSGGMVRVKELLSRSADEPMETITEVDEKKSASSNTMEREISNLEENVCVELKTPLHRCPPAGWGRERGLRLGEMERDALKAHKLSEFCHENANKGTESYDGEMETVD